MLLDTQIKLLKGVGEKRAEQFKQLGVNDIDALLHFYPRDYEDWSAPIPIKDSEYKDCCCLKVTVGEDVTRRKTKSGKMVFSTKAFDESGTINIVIFYNKYSAAKLVKGNVYLLFGQVIIRNGERQISNPSIELPGKKQRIKPIYKRCGTLTSNYIEKCVDEALRTYDACIEDPLPESYLLGYDLMPLKEAFHEIHFPSNMEKMNRARQRFIFEELLELQIGLKIKNKENRVKTNIIINKDYTDEFIAMLPFIPTRAQERCVRTAVEDMMSGIAMNRLLQGDVGSGKTMVAAAIMYTCANNGYQSVLMAPTEILANQHAKTLEKFFEKTSVKVKALTGGTGASEKHEIYDGLRSGEIGVVVGTHALISDNVDFKNLGLVITDEQHRFGVRQRGKLQEKGNGVHVLVMSATPIPRTLARVAYGDLDVSIIDELPKGRVPIETYKIDSSIRQRAFGYIKKFLDEGRQGYIVCPLVEEGELEGVLSATEYYKLIVKGSFKDYRVGLLHGQMKATEKAEVMERFQKGEIQLLVSTVVIEVGVDVPNAVIMLIENAERFGLSQLHQLRGRVGRGKYKSTCILLTDNKSEQTSERLKVMTTTNNGFEIAEDDLRLRGPGEFYGTRQHGFTPTYLSNMINNPDVLDEVSKLAANILDEDPLLASKKYELLGQKVETLFTRIETVS